MEIPWLYLYHEEKKALFKEVKEWLDSDDNAMESLEKSAAPVIKMLKDISDSIKKNDSL